MKRYGYTCPHCGNRDRELMEENGAKPSDPDFTLLCVARMKPGEDSFDGETVETGPDGLTICGMQWCPNEWRDEG